MLLAQLTDLHISTPGSLNDALMRTPDHLARAVAHLNALAPRPDLVLITGDLVERGAPEEYRRLRALLAPLAMPVFVVPGNHDARDTLREAFADAPWLPTATDFFHYAVDVGPLRLIGLDTTIPRASGGELCAARLAWLDARLAEAPDKPTVLFMHHPPFRTGIAAMDDMGLTGGDDLARVVARHPQVERILCGHVHRPITRRFAGTVASVCPATAHQIALDLVPAERLAVVMEPPACALHLWLGPEGGLVSHLSVIDTGRTPLTLFDGRSWLRPGEAPPGFHPE